MEEKEYNNVYAIPANYTDSGKLLGRMLEVRNTVEAAVLLALLTERSIPVKIGYTANGWFCIRFPALLPRKERGGAQYIRSLLYPALEKLFENREPVRYEDCVLIFRHVYDRGRPERRLRDHDNIEVNMAADAVAFYTMPDDGPLVCSRYYCTAPGNKDQTEIYVVPRAEFHLWITLEETMKNEGVKLYATRR